MTLSLKISREVNELDKGIEYPPPELLYGIRQSELNKITDAYLAGLKSGMSLALEAVESREQDKKDRAP